MMREQLLSSRNFSSLWYSARTGAEDGDGMVFRQEALGLTRYRILELLQQIVSNSLSIHHGIANCKSCHKPNLTVYRFDSELERIMLRENFKDQA